MSSVGSVSGSSRDLLDKEPSPAETTAPTDMTISIDLGEGLKSDKQKVNFHKQTEDHKQLQHQVQLLKLELVQKDLVIQSIKADSGAKLEELEEKIADLMHQRSMLNVRFRSQLILKAEEFKQLQSKFSNEIKALRKKQQQLQTVNSRLLEDSSRVKESLRNLELVDEVKYLELRKENPDNLSTRDFATLRLYQLLWPMQSELQEIRARKSALESESSSLQLHLKKSEEELYLQRSECRDLNKKLQNTLTNFEGLKDKFVQDNYKVANFDGVESERKRLEEENIQLAKNHRVLEERCDVLKKELHAALTERDSMQQKSNLLSQDKEYLGKLHHDLARQLAVSEDKLQYTLRLFEKTQGAYENLQEKVNSTKDAYRIDYDAKLSAELHRLREKAERELERSVSSTVQFYEKEKEAFKNVNEILKQQRDAAVLGEKEASEKYQALFQQVQQNQMANTAHTADLEAESRLKAFELERAEILQGQLQQQVKSLLLDKEQLTKKLELLKEELTNIKTVGEKKLISLETQLTEKSHRLESYEALEKEMDDVVMQAAEISDDMEAEKVLFSFGYGANIPTTAKRRLQQNVKLARRVLQLERLGTALQSELESEKIRNSELVQELTSLKSHVENIDQPTAYFLTAIQEQEAQVRFLTQQLSLRKEEVKKLMDDKRILIKTKKQLGSDLEKLLSHREEIGIIREMLTGSQSHAVPGETKHLPEDTSELLSTKKSASASQPEPILFTKSE